jgi:hypothetical protein
MHSITLSTISGIWHATHSDPSIMRLFGTATLPTPFAASMDADDVADRIAALNPGVIVYC